MTNVWGADFASKAALISKVNDIQEWAWTKRTLVSENAIKTKEQDEW
jgi:hypothetical protein